MFELLGDCQGLEVGSDYISDGLQGRARPVYMGSETTIMAYYHCQRREKTREARDRNLDERHRRRCTEIEETERCGFKLEDRDHERKA